MEKRHLAHLCSRAAALLRNKGWCQGYDAVTALNEPTGYLDEAAVRFCLTGALGRAEHDWQHERPTEWAGGEYDALCRHMEGNLGYQLVYYNDNLATCPDDVINLLEATEKELTHG